MEKGGKKKVLTGGEDWWVGEEGVNESLFKISAR